LDDQRYRLVAQLAEAEGITRTALIERWIDAAAARLPQAPTPLPPTHEAPGGEEETPN
jgi:hypothetical protein